MAKSGLKIRKVECDTDRFLPMTQGSELFMRLLCRINGHPGIKLTTPMLYLWLFEHVSPDKPHELPSANLLARAMRCCRHTARRSILQLVDLGLMEPVGKVPGRGRASGQFILRMPPELTGADRQIHDAIAKCLLGQGDQALREELQMAAAAATVENIPQAATTDASKARKPKGRKQAGLTQSQLMMACARPANMGLYLMYGSSVVVSDIMNAPLETAEQQQAVMGRVAQIAPALQPTNWRISADGQRQDPPCSEWTVPQWMGWYWMNICYTRERLNMSLSLPNWGRLGRAFKNLLGRTPAENVHRIANDVTSDFELIFWRNPRVTNLCPDEGIIEHPIALNTIENLPPFDSAERQEMRAAMRAGTVPSFHDRNQVHEHETL